MNTVEKQFRRHVASVVTPGGGFALDAIDKSKKLAKKNKALREKLNIYKDELEAYADGRAFCSENEHPHELKPRAKDWITERKNHLSENKMLSDKIKRLSVPQLLKPLSDEEIKARMPNSVLNEKFFGAIWLRDYLQITNCSINNLPIELLEQILKDCVFMDNGNLHEKIKSYLGNQSIYKNKLSEAISTISEVGNIFDKREYYQDSKEFQVWQICNDFLHGISLPVDNTVNEETITLSKYESSKLGIISGDDAKRFHENISNTKSNPEEIKRLKESFEKFKHLFQDNKDLEIANLKSIISAHEELMTDANNKLDEVIKENESLTSQLSLYKQAKEFTKTHTIDFIYFMFGANAYARNVVETTYDEFLQTLKQE